MRKKGNIHPATIKKRKRLVKAIADYALLFFGGVESSEEHYQIECALEDAVDSLREHRDKYGEVQEI